MTIDDIPTALDRGRLANVDAVLQVREGVALRSGMRTIDLTPMRGIGIRVLPDRGLDVGQAWFGGVPLAWVSALGESGPVDALGELAWSDGFGGGLVVTCGLRNVGMPSEGHGLHGSYAHLPASDVAIERVLDEEPRIVVSGVVVDASEDPTLSVERRITTHANRGLLEIVDHTTNVGSRTADAPILYHINFGFPLWAGPATLALPPVTTTPRDVAASAHLDHLLLPPEVAEGPEWVFEHDILEGSDGVAVLTNNELGIVVEITWDPAELPVLNQWIDPNPGMSVLGIEPANCTTRGRAHDRSHRGVPTIASGATRRTGITIEVWGT